jgi:hypothetical protein
MWHDVRGVLDARRTEITGGADNRAPTTQPEGKTMLRKSLILAFLLAFVPALSFAQDDVRARGDRACKNDASRLCRKVFEQGDMAILACLQENARRLGGSCRRFLQEQGQL